MDLVLLIYGTVKSLVMQCSDLSSWETQNSKKYLSHTILTGTGILQVNLG